MELTKIFQTFTKEPTQENAADKIPQNREMLPELRDGSGQGKETLSMDELERIAGAIEEFAQSSGWEMKISMSEETNQAVVSIISKKDGQVLRQFPPEELVGIAERMQEMVGVLLNNKV